jgi:DNA-binding NarL/FixJ family response regulator
MLLDQSCYNTDITEKLSISYDTVKVHFNRYFRQIGITSSNQTMNFARLKSGYNATQSELELSAEQ